MRRRRAKKLQVVTDDDYKNSNPSTVRSSVSGKSPVHLRTFNGSSNPLGVIRYTYYAFIFSIPFEAANIGIDLGGLSLSRLVGLVFVLTTLGSPRVCFRRPPLAFWCFATYICVFASLGIMQDPELRGMIVTSLFRLIQLLVLFWLSFNLMRHRRIIIEGTLWAVAASCLVLSVLQILGVTAVEEFERISAFDANPNMLAVVLSIGLLTLVGIGYARRVNDLKARLLFWSCSGVIVTAIVRTGSRGAMIALLLSFLCFILQGKNFKLNPKAALITLLAIGFAIGASYQFEAVRVRWERTFFEGDTAGREDIYSAAWTMYLEKPLVGWGPENVQYELGSRLGVRMRDPHNLYLFILLETGLLGAIPFFTGLWLCGRAAWKVRGGIQGFLPFAMVLYFLLIFLKGTYLINKLLWAVLAYGMASRYPVKVVRVLSKFSRGHVAA